MAWKRLFFGSSWASYDTVRPGSIRLLPHVDRVQALRRDFVAMRDMYLGNAPAFDDVLETLADLERRVNRTGSA